MASNLFAEMRSKLSWKTRPWKAMKPSPTPKFEVYTDKAGEFRFRLKAKNGEIIAVGEGYKTKASCLNGIDSIRRNAPEASVEKVES